MPDLERTPSLVLDFEDLGRMPYAAAYARQRDLQSEVIAARGSDGRMVVLLVEHDPPVITVSRRRDARVHLVASPAQLAAAGVEVAETDRGGDITYHGPGQLVVYPILDLNALGLRLHGYMRFLESIVIEVLTGFGVSGHRDPAATGVWVGGEGLGQPGGETRKICAMGVRVSRWVSMHGLALNVSTNLDHFGLIVPCGLAGRPVTSLAREVAPGPEMAEVRDRMIETLRRRIAERHRNPRRPLDELG